MKQRPQRPAREKSRGVAVLELTLSLVFLIPLMLAALDFGYYFYIGATAEEAARQGLQQAISAGIPCTSPANCNPTVGPLVTAAATTAADGTCTTGGNAACYLDQPPLKMGGAATTTVSCSCSTAPVDPTYTITVKVDFDAAVGYVRLLMPAGAGTKVRYTATLIGN